MIFFFSPNNIIEQLILEAIKKHSWKLLNDLSIPSNVFYFNRNILYYFPLRIQ